LWLPVTSGLLSTAAPSGPGTVFDLIDLTIDLLRS
jgi:hypothetical protein